MKSYYIHTIYGRPAFYSKASKQICYLNTYGPPGVLATSLRQIRKEQEATKRYRASKGYVDDEGKYGYKRVAMPKEAQ